MKCIQLSKKNNKNKSNFKYSVFKKDQWASYEINPSSSEFLD